MEVESHLWLRIPGQKEILLCVLLKALRGLVSQHTDRKKMFIVLCGPFLYVHQCLSTFSFPFSRSHLQINPDSHNFSY